MIATASETDAWLAASARLEKERPAPAWLASLRQGAMLRFAQMGFPTLRQEAWRCTSVAAVSRAPFKPPHPAAARFGADDIDRFAFGNWPRAQLVFMDGRFRPELSSTDALPAGAQVMPLSQALSSSANLVQARLARLADGAGQPFTALNTAFIEEGAFIHLPAGAQLAHPVHLLFVSTGAEKREEATVTHPRTLIVAEEGARATVVESFLGDWHGIYLTNAVTEIHVGDGAVVDHCKLQRESGGAFHISTIQAKVAREGAFTSTSISLGAALARHDINVELAGPGASATLNGLYVVDGSQHVDHHTLLDHAAPRCTSRELYKGVLGGQSRGVFDGAVIVRPGAAGTDSQQANRNVLISEEAKVDTKPQLEILADDVKCTHAATVGQIDDNALFYLRSRGIDLDTARNLMIHAFVGEVIHRIGVLPIRKGLDTQTFIRLPGRHEADEVPS